MSNKRNLDVVNHYNSMCNIIPQYKQISLPSPAKKKNTRNRLQNKYYPRKTIESGRYLKMKESGYFDTLIKMKKPRALKLSGIT